MSRRPGVAGLGSGTTEAAPVAGHGPRAPDLSGIAELDGLFKTFERTAWCLRTLGRYRADERSAAYQRFLTGQHAGPDDGRDDAWCDTRREGLSLGKRVERVAIVDDPPTLGQLFLVADARRRAPAGEDIRHLWRADAEWLELPAGDFWLFDSRVLALLRHDEAGCLTGAELVTDPPAVLRACQIRDMAWHHAVPSARFGARTRSSG
jgi:hypothetical protein